MMPLLVRAEPLVTAACGKYQAWHRGYKHQQTVEGFSEWPWLSHVSSCHFFFNLVSSMSRKFRQNERIALAVRSKVFVGLYLAPNYKTCHSTSVSARVVIWVACNRSVTLPETPAGDSRSARQAIWSCWKPETGMFRALPCLPGDLFLEPQWRLGQFGLVREKSAYVCTSVGWRVLEHFWKELVRCL